MSLVRATTAILTGLVLILAGPLCVGANEDCFDCHDDPDLEREEAGTGSVYVSPEPFAASVHGDLDCTDCHQDIDVDDLPHEPELESVHCVDCHDDVQLDFDAGIHGQALARGEPLAPDCSDCHGTHDILPVDDENARTFTTRIPYMCGECHQEGSPVMRTLDIGEHNIIENFSQSIHGEGLFKKGLIVTATCTSCHGAHLILPHTDPRASISPRNIAETCMQCHAQIENVHDKVIRGELWEEAPGAIPSCTSCHLPHRVRKETIAQTISDRDCLECHEKPDLFMVAGADTVSITVDREQLAGSVHLNITCVTCHNDVDPRLDRPCEPSGRIDCSACHAKISEEYFISGHGTAFLEGTPEAPYCTDCHGAHGVMSHSDEEAVTFRAAVPTLCGGCHVQDGAASTTATELSENDAFTDYSSSVHGRGLSEKGLLPSAICIDCHGSHQVLPHTDPRSSVHEANIATTCATCHRGIYKDFAKSIHFQRAVEGDTEHELPTCASCHSSHTIGETEKDGFLTEVTHQCGSCHEHLAETYLDTMHGKAYQLGYLDAAKCSDCHGAHAIFGGNDPQSSVGFLNIVDTCKKCHDDANMRFTGYLTHATHHDPDKYPALYWTYWAMTSLLVGVFGFFGIHTLLWLPRAISSYRERKRHEKAHTSRHYIRRFTGMQMFTHILVIVSFLSLATTGMMLKFSTMPWAVFLSEMLGGVRTAGLIHRTAAVVTFGYFIIHLVSLFRFKKQWRLSLKKLVFDEESLMFNMRDVRDFGATMKWFFGGPRPQYGRWTYWEKFDYMAVFWGVAVIGFSGLMLWFPEFFTKFMPGWLINIATIIHSDEALLAVGFIFTIHFFNTHLRPDAFPMDMVVFTGLVPLEEYRRERPREYEHLKKTGRLRKRMTTQGPSPRRLLIARIFGSVALLTGLVLIGLIIYSVLFGYK